MDNICSCCKPFFFLSYYFANESVIYDRKNGKFVKDDSLFGRCKSVVHGLIFLALLIHCYPLRENDNILLIQLGQLTMYGIQTCNMLAGYVDHYFTGAAFLSMVHLLLDSEHNLRRFKKQLVSIWTQGLCCIMLATAALFYVASIVLAVRSVSEGENPLLISKLYVMQIWSVKAGLTSLLTFVIRDHLAVMNQLVLEIRDDVGNNCNVCNGDAHNALGFQIGAMCMKHAFLAIKDLYNVSMDLVEYHRSSHRFRYFYAHALFILQLGEALSIYPRMIAPEAPLTYQAIMLTIAAETFFFSLYMNVLLMHIDEHSEFGRNIHKIHRRIVYWSEYDANDLELYAIIRNLSENVASNDVRTDCAVFHLSMENYASIITFAVFIASLAETLGLDYTPLIMPLNNH